jgi:membrane associated rhomboid family serine protease
MLYDREYMRDKRRSALESLLLPDPVKLLLIVNVVVFVLQHGFLIGAGRHPFAGGGESVDPWGGLSIDALREGRVWTVVTHLFVHGSIFHLLGNCLGIWFVGRSLQSLLGPRHFLYIYFLSGFAGGALQIGFNWLMHSDPATPIIGASGCGFGIFLALAVILPQEVVTALVYFVIPVRIKLWNLARIALGLTILFGAFQVFSARREAPGADHIAHFAHLGGALMGWYLVRLLGYGGPVMNYDKLWVERQRRAQNREMAGVKQRRRVVDLDESDTTIVPPANTREFIEREIDPILDKIAAHGLSSLTDEERRVLERGREEIIKRGL